MVSAASWRGKRKVQVMAPSGDQYVLMKPDPITLIQFWINECGLEEPLAQVDLSEKVLKDPSIVAKTLMKFIVEPVISESPTSEALSIQELMADQTDSLFLLREVLSNFLLSSDKVLAFFRELTLSPSSGGTLHSGFG